MDLDFGHGFIARVGSDSYKAVDRCLGPGDLWSEALDLPWAIVDGAWADKDPSVLDPLRCHGTKLLVDTAGCRYRLSETFGLEKMLSASWAPEHPLDLADRATLGQFVRASLWAQAKLGADAYLVPGFHPETGTEDLRPVYDQVLHVVEGFSDVPPKPLVLYLGAHSRGLEYTSRMLADLPAFLSGVYLQISPLSVIRDSPTKLERVAHLYMGHRRLECRSSPGTPAHSRRRCDRSGSTQRTPVSRRRDVRRVDGADRSPQERRHQSPGSVANVALAASRPLRSPRPARRRRRCTGR